MPSFFVQGASDILYQPTDVDVETIPQNPQPYEDVTINLKLCF